jgi:hypothetical protein
MRGYLKIMKQFLYYPREWESKAHLKHILVHTDFMYVLSDCRTDIFLYQIVALQKMKWNMHGEVEAHRCQ